VDFDDVADELYSLPPEEFIAVRKERQDEVRAAGDRVLAKDIGTLPKPSAAAWACNLLVRAHREEIEDLVELGNLLREAQQNLAGAELKALDVQRRRLIAALTQQARTAALEAGHPVSTSVAAQVEDTLRAAMSDPEAGEALLTGRLTSPMSFNGGLGTASGRPDLRLVRSPRQETSSREGSTRPAPKPTAAEPRSPQPAEERRRERERAQAEKRRLAEERRARELAEARQAADDATAAAEEASAAAEELRQQVAELDERRQELQARVTELSDQLADAERAAADVTARLKAAERSRKAADREAADAAAERDRARAHAEQLADAAQQPAD
jgi:prefoldin subunit 5